MHSPFPDTISSLASLNSQQQEELQITCSHQSPINIIILLRLSCPQPLHGSLNAPLIIQSNLTQPDKRHPRQQRIKPPRGPYQPLANFRNVIGGHVIHPDPTVSRGGRRHQYTEDLVHHAVGVGVGREHDDGGGDGEEGSHGVMEVGGFAARVSGEGGVGHGTLGGGCAADGRGGGGSG